MVLGAFSESADIHRCANAIIAVMAEEARGGAPLAALADAYLILRAASARTNSAGALLDRLVTGGLAKEDIALTVTVAA